MRVTTLNRIEIGSGLQAVRLADAMAMATGNGRSSPSAYGSFALFGFVQAEQDRFPKHVRWLPMRPMPVATSTTIWFSRSSRQFWAREFIVLGPKVRNLSILVAHGEQGRDLAERQCALERSLRQAPAGNSAGEKIRPLQRRVRCRFRAQI